MLSKHLPIAILFTLVLPSLTGCAYLNGSFQTVEEGRMYRSGQLHEQALQRRMETLDVQTVISLRKPEPEMQWYQQELQVCRDLDVPHHSLDWTMKQIPTPESLQQLVHIIQQTDAPVLIHCHGGVHRSSVAAAVYVLCRTGDKQAARAQLHKHFNDAPIGQLLDLYEFANEPFPQWVEESYPEIYAATVTPQPAHSP